MVSALSYCFFIVDVDSHRLIPKIHVASPLARVSSRSHSCEAWLNQDPAVASLINQLNAHVSLIREVAYPATGGFPITVLGRAAAEEVESHASDVVPMFYNKTSLGMEDHAGKARRHQWAWQ
jgi:hypothetical protein